MRWPLIDERLLTALGLGFLAVFLSGVSERITDAMQPGKREHEGLPSYEVRQDFIVQLAPGNQGIFETLYWMARLVRRDIHDPKVRDAALAIVQDCNGHDFEEETTRLYEFVRDRITYRRDPVNQERVQDARRTLYEFHSGDCDDKVVVLASLIGSIGGRTRFVVCGDSADNFSHVYLQVQDRSGWRSLDPTNERGRAGWEPRAAFRSFYEFW